MILTILLVYLYCLNLSSTNVDVYSFTGDACKSMPCPENTESCEKYLKTSAVHSARLFVKTVCKNMQGSTIWVDSFTQKSIPSQYTYVSHIKNYYNTEITT